MPAPLIQKPILCRIRIHPRFPKIFQTTPKPIKSLPTTRMSLPAALMYSQAIKRHSPHIKYKPQHIKAPIQITKPQGQTTKQIPTPEPKLHDQTPAITNKSLPHSRAGMIPLAPGLRRSPPEASPCWLKAELNCSKGYPRLDTSTLWAPSPWMSIPDSIDRSRDVLTIPTVLDMIQKIVSISSTRSRT